MTAGEPASLAGLFAPAGVAVVGASPSPSRAGGRVFGHLLDHGYATAYPVNPRYHEVRGITCHPGIEDVPGPVDLAVICVSAPRVPEVLRACGRRRVKAAIVHSDGFGPRDGDGLAQQLRDAWSAAGLRMLGPNTNGLRVASTGMLADASTGLAISPAAPTAPIAMITQSGGLGSFFGSVFLQSRGVGARYLVDTGNEFDIDAAEVLSYLAGEPELAAVGLILESCRDGRRLVAAVTRAVAAGVRVLILKLATGGAGASAAESHAGAIAGRFDVFRQLLEAAGARVCEQPRPFVDALALCGRGAVPAGPGVGIVTGSGGFGVLAADLAGRAGLRLPQPTVPPTEAAREVLPLARFANPADLSAQGQQPAAAVARGVEFHAAQPNLDCIAVMQPHSLLHPRLRPEITAGLIEGATQVKVPLYVCGMAAKQTADELWQAARISVFESPDDLFGALGLLVGDPDRAAGADRPPAPPATAATAAGTAGAATAVGTAVVGTAVVGTAAREALAGAPGLPLVREQTVGSAAAAQAFAAQAGGPIVLKVHAPAYAHKSELGLVIGPVAGDEVVAAYQTLARRRDRLGGGDLVAAVFEQGVEIALGMLRDPSFGPVLMAGAGGRLVELLGDVAFAPAPVTLTEADRLLSGLKVSALLRGYRGAPPADIDALTRAMVSLSELAAGADFAYRQVDINPVIVRGPGQGVVAVDYLLVT